MQENVFEIANAAHDALANGSLTQSTPLARHALEVAIRYAAFGQFTASSEDDSAWVAAEVERRFSLLHLCEEIPNA